MKADRPSFTAAWVAALRGLGPTLGPRAQLVEDTYGARFAGPTAQAAALVAARAPRLARAIARLPSLRRQLLWLQLRTRALDDEVRAFVSSGGRQVILLGAGFDARAARLHDVLDGARVLEVDHPATQARKREVLRHGRADRASYVAWDFERDDLAALPEALASAGLDRSARALTIWEGVTMYLSEPAIDATVRAVRALATAGSRLAFTYFDRALIARPKLSWRLTARVVARAGEPFRFGWDPPELPAWLDARDLTLLSDRDDSSLARALLPADEARVLGEGVRHVAVAETR